jgi:hypothetical protein
MNHLDLFSSFIDEIIEGLYSNAWGEKCENQCVLGE